MRADLVSFDFLNSKFQRSRHDCKPEQNRRIRDAGLEHISRGYCVGCPLTVSLAQAHFTPLASAGIATAEACTGTVAVFLTLDYASMSSACSWVWEPAEASASRRFSIRSSLDAFRASGAALFAPTPVSAAEAVTESPISIRTAVQAPPNFLIKCLHW